MQKFSESLMSEITAQLNFINTEHDNPQQRAETAIRILIPALEKLKAFAIKYKFAGKTEEITFFREIKPALASKLVYYNEMYNIAVSKPSGAKKELQKYYEAELKKLKKYFDENSEFYKYYRTGNRSLDNKYFIRGKHDIRLSLDSFYLQADTRFSTSHDYKVARILANDQLRTYLENELAALQNRESKIIPPAKKMKWTGSKVALVELVYALHAESVLNNGNAGIKETMQYFETLFDIDLGQFNRTFLEIRERKSDRTKFLNTLTSTLINRMDDADEN